MNIKPAKTYVLIAEIKRKECTESGIIISAALDTQQAKILAIGPDVTEVSVGDTVLVVWNNAKVVLIDNMQRVMLKEEDIIAVVE